MGARELKVSVDGSVVWEGELEKGCGNQVFDYGKTIILANTDSSEEEPSPRQVKHSNSPVKTDSSPDKVRKSEAAVQRSKVVSPSGHSNGRRDLPKLERRDSKGSGNSSTQVNGEGSPTKSKAMKDREPNTSPSKASREGVCKSSKSVDLKAKSQEPNRSSTRLVSKSKDGIVDLPEIDSSEDSEVEERGSARAVSKVPSKGESNDLSPRSAKSKADRIKSGMRNEAAASLKERDKPKGEGDWLLHQLLTKFIHNQ